MFVALQQALAFSPPPLIHFSFIKRGFTLMVSRILVFAALMIAVVFSWVGHAQAQPGSGYGGGIPEYKCQPWCGGDTSIWAWQYPNTPFQAYVYDHGCQYNNTCCQVTSWYRWRRVCFPPADQYEIEITSISWDRDCIIRNQSAIFDPVPMIRAITYGLLTQNPMHLPPDLTDRFDTTTCKSNYSVKAATCWRNEPGMKMALNCSADTGGYSCCKGGYQVCRAIGSQGQYRDVHWLGQSTVINACVPPCMPSCGAFNEDSVYTRKKDDPPSISMLPKSGNADSVTVGTSPEMMEPKATSMPQQRR